MIGLILGSTRPHRVGPQLAAWLAARCPSPVDLIDLAEVNLPLLDEPEPANGGRYQNAHTLAWAARIAACDSFVLLTPEYNASFPAALKNALDYLFDEWNGKPAGLVGYGGIAAGGRAVQSLLPVVTHLRMIPVAVLHVRFRQYLMEGLFRPDAALDAQADSFLDAVSRSVSAERGRSQRTDCPSGI